MYKRNFCCLERATACCKWCSFSFFNDLHKKPNLFTVVCGFLFYFFSLALWLLDYGLLLCVQQALQAIKAVLCCAAMYSAKLTAYTGDLRWVSCEMGTQHLNFCAADFLTSVFYQPHHFFTHPPLLITLSS